MLGRYEGKRLLDLRSKAAHVIIELLNGKKYEGVVHDYDDEVVALDVTDAKGQKTRKTIYRHAIAEFHTTTANIDTFA